LATNLEKKDPDDSQGVNLVDCSYLSEGKKDIASTKFNDTLAQFPNDLQTTQNSTRIHLQENELDKAKKLYEGLLEQESSNLQTLNKLALIAA
jgi:Tfp pilus assembly protein PilF